MGWTIETYAGIRATGDPSTWRTALFELQRAVNERQGVLGISKTAFHKADETQAPDVTFAQLENIQVFGSSLPGNTPLVDVNLTAIQSAIVSMLNAGYFTEASGKSAVWTKASMETAIGSSLSLAPEGPVDTRFWQAQKDALDRMIYATATIGLVNTVALSTRYESGLTGGDLWGSEADAWADMLADPSPSTGNPHVGAAFNSTGTWGTGPSDTPGYSAQASIDTEYPTLNLATYTGVLTDVEYRAFWQRFNNDYFTGSMEGDIGSVHFSQGNFSGGTTLRTLFMGSVADITIGTNSDVPLTWDIPSETPFSLDTPTEEDTTIAGAFEGEIEQAQIWFDIAAELNDQI